MEEFFKKYGVKNEADFFNHVASDSMFAMRAVSDLYFAKFPAKVVEPQVVQHPDAVKPVVAEEKK